MDSLLNLSMASWAWLAGNLLVTGWADEDFLIAIDGYFRY
tara:strand:+ start:447 stop:566 length:120 start_codon:yes stop_codon:yes gene_type:complete